VHLRANVHKESVISGMTAENKMHRSTSRSIVHTHYIGLRNGAEHAYIRVFYSVNVHMKLCKNQIPLTGTLKPQTIIQQCADCYNDR